MKPEVSREDFFTGSIFGKIIFNLYFVFFCINKGVVCLTNVFTFIWHSLLLKGCFVSNCLIVSILSKNGVTEHVEDETV